MISIPLTLDADNFFLLFLAIQSVQESDQQSENDTNNEAILNTSQLKKLGQFEDRDTQLRALDLTSEDTPAHIVDLFVWGKDQRARSYQPITNLQLAHSPSENQRTASSLRNNAADDDATRSKSFVQLRVQSGLGTATFLSEPAGFDPDTTRFDMFVRRLCFAGEDSWHGPPQHGPGRDLPEFVLQIGKLQFQPYDSTVRHFPGPGYWTVCISIPSASRAGASLASTRRDPDAKSHLPSPTASPAASPPSSRKQQASTSPSTTNGGVWIMFDDISRDEDEDDEDDDTPAAFSKEKEGYVRRRDEAYKQSFGRLSDFQDMPPFDLACIMTDWKDLFRPTHSSTSPDPVQMLRKTATAVCPWVMLARHEEVYG